MTTRVTCATVFLLLGTVLMLGAGSCRSPRTTDPRPPRPRELTLTIPGPDKVALRLMRIEPGTFRMGSPEDEEGRFTHEGPRHEVTISCPFYLGIFEVTQDQWRAVMERNPAEFKGPMNPVENVSWDDCQAFIDRLNRLGIGTFRLPTEAEWEYACRAGSDTPFAGPIDELGWHAGNSDKKTHLVGRKKPNAWGLFDMHGNVLEWCSDWYGPYEPGPQTDPKGPETGSSRVRRGGGCFYSASRCRSANRDYYHPSFRYDNYGFRLAMTPP